MGANAVTSIPDFVALQVLTAAELDVVNCGIPVFADSSARDAAFGGSGEKTLAEGQYAYLESTNATQFYDGAAWQPVAGGLVVVKPETAFTTASSVTADNVFTSAYRNYTIKLTAISSVGNTVYFKLRVGGVSASTNYNRQILTINGTSATPSRLTSQTSAEFGSINPSESALTLNLYNPQSAIATNYDSISNYPPGFTTPIMYLLSGNHSTATAYDGIEFITDAGTITGTYTIYGWGK